MLASSFYLMPVQPDTCNNFYLIFLVKAFFFTFTFSHPFPSSLSPPSNQHSYNHDTQNRSSPVINHHQITRFLTPSLFFLFSIVSTIHLNYDGWVSFDLDGRFYQTVGDIVEENDTTTVLTSFCFLSVKCKRQKFPLQFWTINSGV